MWMRSDVDNEVEWLSLDDEKLSSSSLPSEDDDEDDDDEDEDDEEDDDELVVESRRFKLPDLSKSASMSNALEALSTLALAIKRSASATAAVDERPVDELDDDELDDELDDEEDDDELDDELDDDELLCAHTRATRVNAKKVESAMTF